MTKQSEKFSLSVISGENPKLMTKTFILDSENGLKKVSGGQLVKGFVEKVELSDVNELAVPPVAPTPTWRPIHHSKVIDAVNYAIVGAGLGIQSKRFELSTSGGSMFASYRLDQGRNGVDWQIGFRNSVEKRFAVGITAGTFTLVCSNLMFSGEYIEFRKHTKGLDMDELKGLAHRAIDTTTQKLQALETWQSGLRMVPLLQNSMRALTFEAMHRDAFPAGRFHHFLDAYSTEQAINGPTLLSFFGAVTRAIRDQSLTQISKRSVILKQLMDDFQGHKQSIGMH